MEKIEKNDCVSPKEKFFLIQNLYLELEINRWHNLNRNQFFVMERGPEATEFYTCYYPHVHSKNWNIEQHFSQKLARLRKCKSHTIIYLTATDECIIKRACGDSKIRDFTVMSLWLQDFEVVAQNWYRKKQNAYPVRTGTVFNRWSIDLCLSIVGM